MQNKKLLLGVSYLVLMLISPVSAIAGREAVLRLTVHGYISPLPEWRNAMDQVIDTLDFEFIGLGDDLNPDRSRDSKTAVAKLVNAYSELVSVKIDRPKDCWIGSGQVRDQDVIFLHNRIPHVTDSHLHFRERELQEFAVRFKGQGYGALTGDVRCHKSGSLTYLGH